MATRLAGPGYLVAALLVALPVLDFGTNVWPAHWGDVAWRYGSVGLFSGFILTPVIGLVLAVVVAAIAGHQTVLRALAVVGIVAAVAIVGASVSFVLDVLQLRGSVQQEARAQFDTGAWKALVKYALVAASLAWFGIAGVRGGRAHGRASARARAPVMVQPPPAG
jgi:hypothetical protein